VFNIYPVGYVKHIFRELRQREGVIRAEQQGLVAKRRRFSPSLRKVFRCGES
jgi:hypothetical protein